MASWSGIVSPEAHKVGLPEERFLEDEEDFKPSLPRPRVLFLGEANEDAVGDEENPKDNHHDTTNSGPQSEEVEPVDLDEENHKDNHHDTTNSGHRLSSLS